MRPACDCQSNVVFIALTIFLLLTIFLQDSFLSILNSVEVYFYLLGYPSIEQLYQELMR